jgi:dTDP-4-dehydrorhamnose reductase
MGARVLIFGSTGQLGRELRSADWPKNVELTSLDRQGADFSRPEKLAAIVRRARPDAIVIAAAYTSVDRAETEEGLAFAVNAEAPAAIAGAAAELDAPVLFPSTDYVFNGAKRSSYVEEDPPAPLNAYGRTKLAGEEAVRRANPRHLIVRTSWVYSAHGQNFLRTMLRLAATSDEVRVVEDQRGCPTAAADLAAAIVRIMPAILAGTAPYGLYHLPGRSATTWCGFAAAIFAALAARGERTPRLLPVATRDYPAKARRPLNSALSSARFRHAFGFDLRGYAGALPSVLDEALAPLKA